MRIADRCKVAPGLRKFLERLAMRNGIQHWTGQRNKSQSYLVALPLALSGRLSCSTMGS